MGAHYGQHHKGASSHFPTGAGSHTMLRIRSGLYGKLNLFPVTTISIEYGFEDNLSFAYYYILGDAG